MKLYDLFTEDELNDQIEKKMVKRQSHHNGLLAVLNYTQQATFTPEYWNHVTDMCRGLIYTVDTLEVVARPFLKFWNFSDSRHPETMPENLPSELPVITRKQDGSLGVLYYLNGFPYIATRGSFISDQAEWASKWIVANLTNRWPEGYTPLFEVIYPANQIVVKYDFSGLVLLAMVNIETGDELPYNELDVWGRLNGVKVVERFDKPLKECVEEDIANEEGYVASWYRSGKPPFRVKIKYASYCILHRLLTHTNAITVWEMLRDGLDISDSTKDAPTEFKAWIDGIEARLRSEFKTIENRALVAMLGYQGEKNISNPVDKKPFALYVIANYPDISGILFSMVSGKDYMPIIYKMIRPRGDEKTFVVDEA